jgi:hypothetical protein
MLEARPIQRNNCRCELCGKPIPLGSIAVTFDIIGSWSCVGAHYHPECVEKMYIIAQPHLEK